MATKLAPPPRRDDPRFDDWLFALYERVRAIDAGVDSQVDVLTKAQAQDLTDGGASDLHYHPSDRNRSNHVGTQLAATISDLEPFVRALASGYSDHSTLANLGWTGSGHTGTATTIPGFNASGTAELLTRTGTGTIVVMSAGPTISGTATFSGSTDYSGAGGRIKVRTNDVTRANRTLIQDRTTDSGTNVGVIPNGTSNVAAWTLYAMSDPDNSHVLRALTGATTLSLDTTKFGTGTTRDLDFTVDGVVKMKLDTSGNVTMVGNCSVNGNTTLGDASGDSVTVNAGAVDFPTSGERILLRTNDATRANRTMFKDRGANNGTNVGVIPDGSSNVAALTAFGGSDPDNTHIIQLVTGATLAAINSNKFGTGTQRALELQIAGTTQFGIETDGRLYGVSMHNIGTVTGTAKQYLASGTYTPTITGITNVDAVTAHQCQWMRVGNVGTVSGSADIDPTLAASTVFAISLPIGSAIANDYNLAGSCSQFAIASGPVYGDAPNDRALAAYKAVGTASDTVYFHFTYVIL